MLQVIESISTALKNLYSYKMRSLLTMLGIIIGISSVIMITSLGDGVYNAIYDEMGSFNTTSLQVMPRNAFGPAVLTQDDAQVIGTLHNVEAVATMYETPMAEVILRNQIDTRRETIYGIDQNYMTIESLDMLYGRFISAQDVETNAFVAVLRPEVSLDIFGTIDSVGQTFEVNVGGGGGRHRLTVVGIVDIAIDEISMAQSPVNVGLALIPSSTAGIISNQPGGYLHAMMISLENPDLTMATSEQIVRLLNVRHDMEDGFMALSISAVMDQLDIIFAGIIGFIAFVAGISLFVGGVGVMNIMMVTVTERTREIGIRKSLGATGAVIRLQFISEAVILTAIGGVIGIISGISSAFGLVTLVNNLSPMHLGITIDYMAIAIAIIVSTAVGVIFGVYPAGKAAKLDPVDSLRYE